MLNTRRALDDVPFMNDPDRLSSFLIKAFVLVRGSRIEGFLRKPRCEVWLSCAFSPLVLEKSQLPKWRTCSVLRVRVRIISDLRDFGIGASQGFPPSVEWPIWSR
jgi:hypothetical protein